MTTNRSRLAFWVLLSVLSVPAVASDLSYTFGELRLVDTEIGNNDGDGFRLNGSYEIGGNWLLVGGFSTLEFDGGVDLSALEAGAGYIHRHTDRLDIVGVGKLVRTEVDFPGGSDDDIGISLAGGVRGRVTPQIEGRAFLNYFNVDDTDTFFEVGGDYYFSDQVSAGLTLEFGGDADTLTFGVRWFFAE